MTDQTQITKLVERIQDLEKQSLAVERFMQTVFTDEHVAAQHTVWLQSMMYRVGAPADMITVLHKEFDNQNNKLVELAGIVKKLKAKPTAKSDVVQTFFNKINPIAEC